jgi:hypothetical protein
VVITGVLWEQAEDVEKLTCNMKQAYIAGDNLDSWNILLK